MNKVIFASTKDSDMHYAVKTPITSSFFYIETRGEKYALLDKVDFGIIPKRTRIKTVLSNQLSTEAKKLKFRTSDRNKLAYYIFKKYGLVGRKVEVPIHFPLDMADFLRKYGAKLIPTFPFFPERAVKTKDEIGYIKESLSHTKLAFCVIENILRRSKIRGKRIYFRNKILTSEFLKQEAEKALAENGMFDLLGMIVSTGDQTAIPHHDGTGPIRPHQPIVCDIFPRHRASGYFADMTRTFVKGKPSVEIEKMYGTILKAQKAAEKKIRAGIRAKEVYDIAAEVIYKSGYDVGEKLAPHQFKAQNMNNKKNKGEAVSPTACRDIKNTNGIGAGGFIHGLGHGVGLDIHEKPSLKANSEDILKAGNIITIEPGLYYSGIGGVRIEDMVLVTKTGCQNLTNYPKKFIIK
ncbi:MAG: M24 family metallopeptidase [Candidatus Moranbacteria bacterium]|nr:M24 family metallopeptidase [Candidatus Moranbacteria bacterium]